MLVQDTTYSVPDDLVLTYRKETATPEIDALDNSGWAPYLVVRTTFKPD